MSTGLSLLINTSGRYVDTNDLSVVSEIIQLALKSFFSGGSSTAEVNKCYSDSRTTALPAILNFYDGSLSDNFGRSLVFSNVWMIYFKNRSGSATASVYGTLLETAFVGDGQFAVESGGLFVYNERNSSMVVNNTNKGLTIVPDGLAMWDLIVLGN